MSRELHCRCLVCGLERHLREQFATASAKEAYRQLAHSSLSLSAFPDSSDLLGYLHGNHLNGNQAKDKILSELLQTLTSGGLVARELLLLAFIPVLHSVARHVATRHPVLSPDDIAQHVVAEFLELCGSPEFLAFDSHVAFAMARLLRRNAFVWAERESRPWALRPAKEEPAVDVASDHSARNIERSALLQHFLHRCQMRGVVSGEDLELLAQFKLDRDGSDYSNASRQRMKRLVGKLRRAAKPRRSKHDDRQLRLF